MKEKVTTAFCFLTCSVIKLQFLQYQNLFNLMQTKCELLPSNIHSWRSID